MAEVGKIGTVEKWRIDDLWDEYDRTKEDAPLEQMFDLFDRDQSGHIERKEVKEILMTMNGTVREADIDEAFAKNDINQDGLIEKAEFVVAMKIGRLV